ncbi:hypothetical protein yidX [Escherichia coli P12b]|nr:hypothetical protein yidX [Escherichia coli P12b]
MLFARPQINSAHTSQ